MRFVRAFVSRVTGQIEHVRVCEVPFGEDDPAVHLLHPQADGSHVREDYDMHELGLAEHFDACHAITGGRCSAAAHLFQRLEAVPAPQLAAGMQRFRAKAGHESAIPMFHEVPTTLEGILSRLRAGGPSAVHERVGYWLHFMGVLSDAQMDAAALRRIPLSVALEFDTMRVKRDPSVGSRAVLFKRAVRHRAMRRASKGA